jgi:predicted nuclease of predicted toxin-antitoxin system
MRFLLDQDVYAVTTRFLRELGHDVVVAADIGYSQAEDVALLGIAREQDRIFVTRDRDFGGLVFVKNLGAGVIYRRILPSTLQAGHKELATVLQSYAEEELRKAFVVVEPGRHRFRKLSQ